MFDLNQHYDRPDDRQLIQILKACTLHVSYQQATYQKDDRRGHESPLGWFNHVFFLSWSLCLLFQYHRFY